MKLRLYLLAGALTAVAYQPQTAFAIDTTLFGTSAICTEGECANGSGTILTADGMEYKGRWANGRFITGSAYQLKNPVAPERTETLILNEKGQIIEGTLLRGSKTAGFGLVGEFTGTFAQVSNPFIAREVSAFARGAYTDYSNDYIYEGEFTYIPINSGGTVSGYYILSGVRIDTALDEVTQGLFVSDRVMQNMPITFRKARPDYLDKIHSEYAAQKLAAETNAARIAAQQASAATTTTGGKRGGGLFGRILSVASGLATIGGVNIGPLKSNALMGLAGSLSGKNSPDGALNGIMSSIMKSAIKDPKLAGILGSAHDPEKMIATLTGIAANGRTLKRADYAAERAAELEADGSRSGSAQTMRAVAAIVKGGGSTQSILKALGGIAKDNLIRRGPQQSTAAAPLPSAAPRTAPPAAPSATTASTAPAKASSAPIAKAPPQAVQASVPAPTGFSCATLEASPAARKAILLAAAEKAKLDMFVSPQFRDEAVGATFLGCRAVPRESGKGSQPMRIPGHPMTSYGFIYDAYRGYLDGKGAVLSAMTVRADLVSGDMAEINYYPADDGPDIRALIGGTAKGYWIYVYQ